MYLPVAYAAITHLLSLPQWQARYAALMSISAMSEGCAKQMRDHLADVMQFVLPYLTDPVRRKSFDGTELNLNFCVNAEICGVCCTSTHACDLLCAKPSDKWPLTSAQTKVVLVALASRLSSMSRFNINLVDDLNS